MLKENSRIEWSWGFETLTPPFRVENERGSYLIVRDARNMGILLLFPVQERTVELQELLIGLVYAKHGAIIKE